RRGPVLPRWGLRFAGLPRGRRRPRPALRRVRDRWAGRDRPDLPQPPPLGTRSARRTAGRPSPVSPIHRDVGGHNTMVLGGDRMATLEQARAAKRALRERLL